MEICFVLLLGYCFVREMVYHYNTHKLINKAMSRDFHDYQFSKHVEKTMKTSDQELREGIKAEEELAEDLSPINQFMG